MFTFLSYRQSHNSSQVVQWLKGISSRAFLQDFPHLRKQLLSRHLGARGYLAVYSDTITDEIIQEYIEGQEGGPIRYDS